MASSIGTRFTGSRRRPRSGAGSEPVPKLVTAAGEKIDCRPWIGGVNTPGSTSGVPRPGTGRAVCGVARGPQLNFLVAPAGVPEYTAPRETKAGRRAVWSGAVCRGLNRRFVMRLAAVLLLGLGLAVAFLGGANAADEKAGKE